MKKWLLGSEQSLLLSGKLVLTSIITTIIKETRNHSKSGQERRIVDLHGEVMACGYGDVQVMWSILDKSKPRSPGAAPLLLEI
ncbi:hypothetical protein OROHE_015920 [Orobanche hederae]